MKKQTLATLLIAALAWPMGGFAAAGQSAQLEGAYREIQDDAFQHLPPVMLNALPKLIHFLLEEGKDRIAEVQGDNVYLKSEYLRAYVQDASAEQFHKTIKFTRHPDFKTFLAASVAHELAHIYDRQSQLSSDVEFSDLIFNYSYADTNESRHLNSFAQNRSVDPYEYTNTREAFAVNFEFFTFDPEFKCRKPGLYNYYARKFQIFPFAQQSCDDFIPQFYISPTLDKNFNPTVFRPQGKLYAIHFLLAGSGKGLVSGFGHAMLRLIYCDPSRAEATEECLYDFDQHVVITPAAGMFDLGISTSEGLTGKYHSALFAAKLSSVVTQYTMVESRDVYSVPLHLTIEQLKSLEQSILESHWTYENRYYFTINNCGVEIANLLSRALHEKPELDPRQAATPKGLYETLLREGLVENHSLVEFRSDQTKRFFYPSWQPRLDQWAAYVAEQLARPEATKYLDLDSQTRSEIFSLALHSMKNSDRLKSAVINLEINTNLRLQEKFMNAAGGKLSSEKDILEKYAKNKSAVATWAYPSEVVSSSHYGLPTKTEVDSAFLMKAQAKLDVGAAVADERKAIEDFSKKFPEYQSVVVSNNLLKPFFPETVSSR